MNRLHLYPRSLALLLLSLLAAGCVSVGDSARANRHKVEVRVDNGGVLGEAWADAAARLGQDGKKPAAKAKAPAGQKPAAKAAQKPAKPEADPDEKELPFIKFGPDIFVDEKTGKITKIYPVPKGMGSLMRGMLTGTGMGAKSNFIRRMLAGHDMQVEMIDGKIHQSITGVFAYGQVPPAGQAFNDILAVTSTMKGLEAYERAFNLLFTAIPQIDISVKVVQTSFTESMDIGVRQSGAEPTIKRLLSPDKMFIRDFTANFPNATGLGATSSTQQLFSEGLFTIGGIHDDWQLQAILELIQKQDRSEIISQPHIAVRNGGVAEIATTQKIPWPNNKIVGQTITQSFTDRSTGVTMKIRPTLTGTDTIMLNLDVKVEEITGYEEFDPIRIPIISSRSAKTDVFVRDGQSVAIGGLLTETETETESKVPLLGDIPVVGMLFRSTFKETRKTEVIFFITPQILRRYEARGFDPIIDDTFID